jgi:hypothetical protein
MAPARRADPPVGGRPCQPLQGELWDNLWPTTS